MTDKTTLHGIHMDDWIAQSDEERFEVVDGEVIPMHPPILRHVWISQQFLFKIYDYLKDHPIGMVWQDNATYILESDESGQWVKGSVIPDASFILQERIDEHKKIHGEEPPAWWLAPDLAIEVVSPNDRHSAIMRKVDSYLQHGTQLVWVVDPQNNTIQVYSVSQPTSVMLREGDTLVGEPVLPDFRIAVSDILSKF